MKWFKHDSDANMDARVQEVLLDYGLEGYGLYWYCIELITQKIDSDKITFELEHDARVIARNTGSSVERVETIMKKFVELGLFENSEGIITCMKLAKRLDKSMSNSPKMREFIGRMRTSANVMTPSEIVSPEVEVEVEVEVDKKKIITTTSDNPPKYEDADIDFAKKAFEEIQKVNPNHKAPDLKKWAEEVSRMVRIDNRTLFEMAELWVWVRQDPFWKTNILSMAKFRDKYDQLLMKAKETAAPTQKGKVAKALRNVADTDW
jgi:hypothetical protein